MDPATTAASRRQAAKTGVALPDGSFPIPDQKHLRMAMQAFGRCPPEKRAALVNHIRTRARALGAIAADDVQQFLTDHAGGKTKGA